MSKKRHHEEELEENVNVQEGEELTPENTRADIPAQDDGPQAEENKPAAPDYYERFVRLSADFDNYRKRTEREKVSFLAYGKKQFAEKLLPAYEVMLRQREQMEKDAPSEACEGELKSLRDGLRLILTELDKAFAAEGVTRMDVLDKPYDPNTQEVVAMVPAPAQKDGLVLQEVQMGFMMDGNVLRPARVIVGRSEEEDSSK